MNHLLFAEKVFKIKLHIFQDVIFIKCYSYRTNVYNNVDKCKNAK